MGDLRAKLRNSRVLAVLSEIYAANIGDLTVAAASNEIFISSRPGASITGMQLSA